MNEEGLDKYAKAAARVEVMRNALDKIIVTLAARIVNEQEVNLEEAALRALRIAIEATKAVQNG